MSYRGVVDCPACDEISGSTIPWRDSTLVVGQKCASLTFARVTRWQYVRVTNVGRHVYLARHGQTQWNIEHRYQGQLDSPLTDKGQGRLRNLRLSCQAEVSTRSSSARSEEPSRPLKSSLER